MFYHSILLILTFLIVVITPLLETFGKHKSPTEKCIHVNLKLVWLATVADSLFDFNSPQNHVKVRMVKNTTMSHLQLLKRCLKCWMLIWQEQIWTCLSFAETKIPTFILVNLLDLCYTCDVCQPKRSFFKSGKSQFVVKIVKRHSDYFFSLITHQHGRHLWGEKA